MEIASVVIAASVALIGYLQWQTSHQRVVLDLFDRRRAVYDEVAAAIRPIIGPGRIGNSGADRMLAEAMQKAIFLFGDDVNDYLEKLRIIMIDMRLCETMIDAGDDKANWNVRLTRNLTKLMDFYTEFPKLCVPYLRLDEKRLPPPMQMLGKAKSTLEQRLLRKLDREKSTNNSARTEENP